MKYNMKTDLVALEDLFPLLQRLARKFRCKCAPYITYQGLLRDDIKIQEGYNIVPLDDEYKYDSVILYVDINNYEGTFRYQPSLHHTYKDAMGPVACTEGNLRIVFNQYFKQNK